MFGRALKDDDCPVDQYPKRNNFDLAPVLVTTN